MKRHLPNAPFLALIFGSIAMVLRFWMLAGGTDDKGLYPRFHIAWVLLCLLALGVTVFFWLLSRQTDPKRSYKENFPASPIGAGGFLLGGLGAAVGSIIQWKTGSGWLTVITSLVGLGSAALLVFGGYLRLGGQKPPFLVHAIPCLYFCLRMFSVGRVLGSDPTFTRNLFPFLATLALLPASYHLWGFDVNLGHRQKSLFWSLLASFLCLAALPDSAEWLLYLGVSLFLLTNLCSLQPVKRPKKEAAPEVAAQEVPLADPLENLDTDDLIAQIMQDLGDRKE